MKILADAAKGAVEGFIGGVGKIIDDLNTSDEEKAAAAQAAAELGQRTLETVIAAGNVEVQAQKEILVAELGQGDSYTKRARPTLVYAGLAFIAMNYVVFPMLGRVVAIFALFGADKFDPAVARAFADLALPLADLPEAFWMAWGGVTGTWVLGRSLERGGVAGRVMDKIAGKATPGA